MSESYNRFNKIKISLNKHLAHLTKVDKDFVADFTIDDIFQLKNALSDVHNILTLFTTIYTLDWIAALYNVDDNQLKTWKEKINKISPNAGGFDIILDDVKVIVEVKCLKPADSNVYQGAQRDSLMVDIRKLLNRKNNSKYKYENYFKVLVIADLGDNTNEAIAKFLIHHDGSDKLSDYRKDFHYLINNKKVIMCPDDFKIQDIELDTVYIKPIKIKDDFNKPII